MPSNRILYRLLLSAAFALCCGLVNAQDLPPLTHGLMPVDGRPPAPPLRLPDLDEATVDLADFRGKVIVVNFWATWCPPCRREMGSLERLYRAAGPRGVEVLAVNIGEDADTVFAFLGTIEPYPNFKLLFDADAAALDAWGVKGLPTTFIVDADSRVAYRAVGGREFDHPEIVNRILALTPP